ncbi:MAG TPA: VWA domain-containing protein [Candidatus Saccharimonadales bacterium]|nr:VWA domain-containing protein [Candidatus Saccharimonadales bacterium]
MACFLLACQPLLGQQEATISVKVKVVNTLATVRDKHGQIIPNLTQDDFDLQEDGRPQTIRYFSRETGLPLTLGLLVDTSLSQRRVLEQERTASYTFLDEMLRQDMDLAFVIHFDFDVELLQDLTASHRELGDALGLLRMPQPEDIGGGGGPRGGPGPRRGGSGSGGGTVLYDAVYLGSNDLMKKQEGRKALIILSDGVDTGSKVGLAEAIESAQRSDTVVYSILFYDEQAYGPGGVGWGGLGRHGGHGGPRFPTQVHPDGKKVLERLSKETGGRMFEVSKKDPIDKVYSQIEDELRSQYSIGYTPERDARPGYRKIKIVAKQKGLIVQARSGYYGEQ